jgi:hypothetical protein
MRFAIDHSNQLDGLVIIDTSPFAAESPTLARIREFMLGAGLVRDSGRVGSSQPAGLTNIK